MIGAAGPSLSASRRRPQSNPGTSGSRNPGSRRIGDTRISTLNLSPGSRVLSIRPLRPALPRGRPSARRANSMSNPGYLVVPASALIDLLAGRTSGGSFPAGNLGLLHGHGMSGAGLLGQQSLGLGGVGQSGAGFMGQPRGIRQGGARLLGQQYLGLRGAGQSALVSPPMTSSQLLNALGITRPGALGIRGGNGIGLRRRGGLLASTPMISGVPAGLSLLGRQGVRAANLIAALRRAGVSSANLRGNQQPSLRNAGISLDGANNIIIQDTGADSNLDGPGLVIDGPGGTITIRGSLFGGAGAVEAEEFETEEGATPKPKISTSTAPPNQNTGSGSPIISVVGGNGQQQVISFDGSSGTLVIGDKTPSGAKIPGNATFILNSNSNHGNSVKTTTQSSLIRDF